MTTEADIEQLFALGRMDLEAGYPEYARQYFEKVLALDAANREAIDALAEIDALLERRRASSESVKPELESAQPEVTLPKPASDEEEMGETNLAEDEYSQPLPTDLTELLQFQCQQLTRVLAELQKHRTILDKHTEHLRSISNVALFVLLLIVIGLVLSMCSGFMGTY